MALWGISFRTESGSEYEVDYLLRRIRRLSGDNDPTPRQGEDGEWKTYYHISPVFKGDSVLVFWDNKGKATMTSPVIDVWETEQDES